MPDEDYDGDHEDDYLQCVHIYEVDYFFSFYEQFS